jgi:uncharacterized protein YdeI (YjbR/CyaY-like superfamily)
MKKTMPETVDAYLVNGCMRCKLGATPLCKVNNWQQELVAIRKMIASTGLVETIKWGVPCYTYHNKNIAILSAFKEYCSLSFFKGALLNDPYRVLQQQGESSQAARLLKYTNLQDVLDHQNIIKEYLFEAMEIEKQGKKITFQKNPEPIPEELLQVFEQNLALQNAFFALTPGKQRGYIIYFSQPKQSITRLARIEKYTQQIMNGIGFHDNYKKQSKTYKI